MKTTAQLQAKRAQLDAEASEIDAALTQAVETKSYTDLEALEKRVSALADARKDLEREEAIKKATSDPRYAALRNYRGDAGNFANAAGTDSDGPVYQTKKLGRDVCPLAFTEESLKRVHKAMQDGQSIRVKAFSTVEPLLPAQLFPSVIGRIHEHRLLDRLPVTSMSAPSLEFLVHQSSTGTPAITAEGALKPDVTLNFLSSTITAQKIAATFGLSWEVTRDFPALIGYCQGEIFKSVIDIENAALINGTTGIVGFQQTSGILTLAYTTGAYLDTFSQAIENLRVGSALAEANLIVMHPGTFGAIRRQKDGQSRYLLNPDPARDEANNIWGVEVIQTTACPAGTALLLDTQKFGFVAMRQNLEILSGFTNDDFQRNINRWAVEERLNLAVERPAACLNITGLPVS
jgi:HK97 family phage major capsid protein